MATAYEIQKVFQILTKEVNKTFIDNGLDIRVSKFNIKILTEQKMVRTGCDGIYINGTDEIQLRRGLFTDLIDTLRSCPDVNITKLYKFQKIKKTLIHEIGHSVHFKTFNCQEFNLKTVSNYGDKNSFEKFAVAFEEYLTDGRYDNGLKSLIQYI